MHTPSRDAVWGVFLIALATLLFEVSLTRVFAVTLWYHFGFLAISLALVGTTAAAVCCFIWFKALVERHHRRNLGWFALAFALLVPLAMWCHLSGQFDKWNITGERFYLVLGTQILLLFACFFAAGMCISIAVARYRVNIGKLYCFDLLGAALGTLLLVPLLYHFSPLALCFLVTAVALAAAALFWRGIAVKGILATGITGALALFWINDTWGLLRIERVKSHAEDRIQYREPKKLHEQWSPLGRIAVFKTRNPNRLRVTNDAAAPTSLHRFDGDLSKYSWLSCDLRQVVHRVKRNAKTLIIGSAGGKDVLAALVADQPAITAVEINPITAQLVLDDYADYTGRLFYHPRVNFHVAEGRHFVARSSEKYDVIQISMIDSWQGANGGYVFNENNLYTLEAINDYLAHLREDGVLSITRYFTYDEAIRLANIMLTSLEKQGISDGHARLMAVLENGPRKRATLLLKRGRFTADEVQQCAAAAKAGRDFLLYAPGVETESLYQSAEADTFRSLIAPAQYGLASRHDVVDAYPKNIAPSTDDQPFFFFTLKLADAFSPDMSMHGARRMALPLLYGSLLFLMLVAAATSILPLALSRSNRLKRTPGRGAMLIYFACLGAGFMLVEMALIHRVTVFLGYPTYAMVVVLTTILCAGGLGSLTAGRWASHPQPGKLIAVLTAASFVLTLFALLVFDRLNHYMWLPDASRIALAVAAVALPGYLMGMCFPLGIPLARALDERLVAWSWGVNGAFSVLGSSLSLVLALNFGLKATLLLGAACYLMAAAAILIARRRIPRETLEGRHVDLADDASNHGSHGGMPQVPKYLMIEEAEAARQLERLAAELERVPQPAPQALPQTMRQTHATERQAQHGESHCQQK